MQKYFLVNKSLLSSLTSVSFAVLNQATTKITEWVCRKLRDQKKENHQKN